MNRKVIEDYQINQYRVLILDGPTSRKPYRRYRIDGKVYEMVRMTHAQCAIAVESEESFLGKTVEFIL